MTVFTVVICTYNGSQRLPLVLESLCQQKNVNNVDWEVMVVDNNSTENTQEVVNKYQEKWVKNSNLRSYFESEQGLAFARQRGVEEANSPWVGFLDDDNIPEVNWLEEVLIFAQKHPQIGAFGSEIKGDFDRKPPENFDKIACFLAIINRGNQEFIYEVRNRILPPGSGLVVNRQAWLNNVPKKLFLIGKIGDLMLVSEDLEALIYLQKSGYEIWHNPRMKIKHKIPASRLEKEYLLSLIRGIGLVRYYIRMLRIKPWLRPFFTILFLVNDAKKNNPVLYKNTKTRPTGFNNKCL